MAVRDHTAPARPCILSGDASVFPRWLRPFTADPSASLSHPSTLDDISMALFTLSRLREYGDCSRKGAPGFTPRAWVTWPLSASFEKGLSQAIQRLRQYAGTLGLGPMTDA